MRHKPQELTTWRYKIVMYNMSIIIYQCVLNNRTDLIIWNKSERTGLIVDAAVPMDRNFVKTYVYKLTDIHKGWNMKKLKTITITVGYLGKLFEVLQENI